jgi:hypothetical protein
VVDAWQRRGVASALIGTMVPRVRAAGVRVAVADLEPRNVAARAMIRSVFGNTVQAAYQDGLLHFRMQL